MASIDPALLLPPRTGPVLVGYSGGLDSTVLLHLLSRQPAVRAHGLRAIHVQHQLHPDAADWARHCQSQCRALDIDLLVSVVDVATDSGLGPEGAARLARHAAFAAQLGEGECLALAHHADDQAETVLQRLLRASGADGLAAMRPLRPFAKGSLWRPLLGIAQAELLAFALAEKLAWIEDPSNSEHAFDRNFLRHRVLPVLRERWPTAIRALARSAALLAEESELLGDETRTRLALARTDDPASLSVSFLLAQAPAWRARLLREWASQLGLPPIPGGAFQTIDAQLLQARPDACPEYRWAGMVLTRWRDLLHAEPVCDALPPGWRAAWDGSSPLPLPTGDYLEFVDDRAAGSGIEASAPDLIARGLEAQFGAVEACARHGGERIRLAGREHSHSLRNCLQEAAIPPWHRLRLPLLETGEGEVLAAGDVIASGRFLEFCRKQGVRLSWHRQPPRE